jgi:D-alanyl-D-alanine endopeptidase (penicillin-binding protein 7)
VIDASTQGANDQALAHNIEAGGIDSGVSTDAEVTDVEVTDVEVGDSGLNSDAEPMLLAASGVKHTYKPVAKSAGAAKGSAAPTLKNASYIPPARANEDAKTFRGISLVASSALAVDAQSGETLYFKNPERTMPIASITKLMTAMVVLDAKLPMQETLSIGTADVDRLKNTTSRLPVGTKLNRQEMIRLALMSSENRAASALARHYPGGRAAFLTAMRRKAAVLGMTDTRFNDSTGLTPTNVSTARDLVKMVRAASQYPLIRRFTTTSEHRLRVNSVRYPLEYRNTNRLVRGGRWNISLSKTGFINEAGHCLVMMADVGRRPVVMVLLQTPGKLTPLGDATRLRNWIEGGGPGLTVATTK